MVQGPELVARGMEKRFETGFRLRVEELVLRGGGTYAFVGSNGAGKTVLLEALSLLDPPERGEIFLGGERIFPDGPRLEGIRRRMTLVAQKPYLFRGTVLDNAMYGLRARGVGRRRARGLALAALQTVGLAEFARRRARELSGGQAQRLALARALAVEQEVLLIDEPTAHVDAEHLERVEDLLRGLRARCDSTVLLATHSLPQAYRLSDEVFLVARGKVHGHAPENLFFGRIERADGMRWFRIGSTTKIQVLKGKVGAARVSIDPRSILLSRGPLRSSGRNCLLGMLAGASIHGDEVRVRVDVDGTQFRIVLTRQSFTELGLAPGIEVYLTFKAASVVVY